MTITITSLGFDFDQAKLIVNGVDLDEIDQFVALAVAVEKAGKALAAKLPSDNPAKAILAARLATPIGAIDMDLVNRARLIAIHRPRSLTNDVHLDSIERDGLANDAQAITNLAHNAASNLANSPAIFERAAKAYAKEPFSAPVADQASGVLFAKIVGASPASVPQPIAAKSNRALLVAGGVAIAALIAILILR